MSSAPLAQQLEAHLGHALQRAWQRHNNAQDAVSRLLDEVADNLRAFAKSTGEQSAGNCTVRLTKVLLKVRQAEEELRRAESALNDYVELNQRQIDLMASKGGAK
jgi:ABC-type transporter Mla subunit MlaD